MDDKDNRSNSNRSKGDESFLAVVQNVWLCQREWVVKNELGGGKVYAVLGEVFAVLLFVPFKGHAFNPDIISQSYVQLYIHLTTPSTRLRLHLRRLGFGEVR